MAARECRTFVAGLYGSQPISKPPYFSSHIQERQLRDSAVLLINTSKPFVATWPGFQALYEWIKHGFTVHFKWKRRRLDCLRHDKIRAQWQFSSLCMFRLRRQSSLALLVLQSYVVSVLQSSASVQLCELGFRTHCLCIWTYRIWDRSSFLCIGYRWSFPRVKEAPGVKLD